METFVTLYSRIVKEFTLKNSLVRIEGNNTKINWPNGSGVYAIWKNNTTDVGNLIYVGLSGKFKRNRDSVT